MKVNSLGTKIGGGFLLSTTILFLVVATTLYLANSISLKIESLYVKDIPINQHSANIQSQVNRSLAAIRGWVSINNTEYREELSLSWDSIYQSLKFLTSSSASDDAGYRLEKIELLEKRLAELRAYQLEIRDIAHTGANKPGMKILEEQGVPLASAINEAITTVIGLEMLEGDASNRKNLLKNMADFRGSMANSVASLRGFLLTGKNEFKLNFDRFWQINENSFASLEADSPILTNAQKENLFQIKRAKARFELHIAEMIQLRQSRDWNLAQKYMQENIVPLETEIQTLLRQLVEFENNAMETKLLQVRQNYSSLTSYSMGLLFLGLVLCIALAVYITRLVVNPLAEVVQLANDISSGRPTQKVKLTGAIEIEQLSNSLSKMVNVISNVTKHANELAKGEFKNNFEPQNKEDRLGNSLHAMTLFLREAKIKSNEQDWLKSGQSGLAERLRSLTGFDELYSASLSYVCRYLGASVGALYLRANSKSSLVSSFAYQNRSNNDIVFEDGQGMVGQVAKEQESIVFKMNLDTCTNMEVNFGLGHIVAEWILVAPIIDTQQNSNEVLGVVALGFNSNITELQKELLEKLLSAIASAIASANYQSKLQTLLVESQQQTAQLKEQQEELEASNAELEEQTSNLAQAEEELRAQRKDLQNSNNELVAKTKTLEKLNVEIKQKNSDVEEAKHKLEIRASELEQANRYKSEFLANMSHELRTPLNSLLILSQILAENKKQNLTDDQIEDLRMINEGGKSLLSLINDILDLSKIEAGKLEVINEPVDIIDVCETLTYQFQNIALNKGIDFSLCIEKDIERVCFTDRLRLEQILRNLLSNAIKFTDKGSVNLHLTDYKMEDNSQRKFIQFIVKDTGIGIPEDMQHAIFKAFQQADGSISRNFGGTGLGLTISQSLSQLIDAKLELESEENVGSTFVLTLPLEATNQSHEVNLQPEDKPDTQESLSLFVPDDRNNINADLSTVLIVEDDEAFATSLIRFARSKGFQCIATNKGIDALELVMSYTPDAVLLDLGLPDIDGFKVLDGLKQSPLTSEIPIYVISGHDKNEAAIEHGAFRFISKPANIKELEQIFTTQTEMSLEEYQHVLLVESNEESCQIVRKYLEDQDIAISTVKSGDDGLELLEEREFDCIVLDLNLSNMTGLNWLESAIKIKPQLPPVVIYTAKELTAQEYQQLQLYTDSFVLKGNRSHQRLKDEVSLFLYDVKSKQAPSTGREEFEKLEGNLNGKKILVVDDDIRNVYALSKILQSYGMEVIIADNGELAIEKLTADADVDLILMDIMMPQMDGYEAMKQIRAKYKNKHPIIALTAKAMADDREQCKAAGANDYLSKPVDVEKLVSMVKVWLNQQS